MPRSTDPFAAREARDILANSHNVTDQLVAGGAGEHISHQTVLLEDVGVADTAGNDLDQDLAATRLL